MTFRILGLPPRRVRALGAIGSLGDIDANTWVQQSGFNAAYFDSLAPGAWNGPGRSDIVTDGPSYNPTLSNDPTVIAMVNQQLANGNNPITGQPTALNLAVLNKGYRWQGAGDIVNPYTQQSVGNAFALGLPGVQALPVAFNVQAAWDNLSELAYSRGYIVGADGSLQSRSSGALSPVRFPTYDQIATGGESVYQQAIATINGVPLDPAAGAAPAPVDTTIAPPPQTIVTPTQTSSTSQPPSGWHQGGYSDGTTGWWAPDGLFYPGATPWTSYAPGSGKSINPTISAPGGSPPSPDAPATTRTTPKNADPLGPGAPATLPVGPDGGATYAPGGIITEAQPLTAGFGGTAAVLIGLGLLGAAVYAAGKKPR